MRKIVVIFCATGNQKIRPSGKIKENILLEEISGYQSVVYFLPSVSGCYLAQLPLISIKSVLILLPINSFLLTALPSVSGALLRVPYSFMVPIFGGRRWTVFSTAILIIPCVWLGIAVQNRILLWDIYRYRFAMRFCRCKLCFEHGQYQFLLSKSQTRSALGINGGLGNLGVSVMQLVAPLVILYLYLPFSASMAYRRPTVRWCRWRMPHGFGYRYWRLPRSPPGQDEWYRQFTRLNCRPAPCLTTPASLAAEPALPCHLRFVYRFSAGFAMLAKTQFPDVNILRPAFLAHLSVPSRGRLVVLFPISSAACGWRWSTLFLWRFSVPCCSLPCRAQAPVISSPLRRIYGAVSDCGSGKWFYFPDDRRHLSPDNHLSGKDERR